MLDSIYLMTLKLIKIAFLRENVKILSSFRQRFNGLHNVSRKVVYLFYCIALHHSQMQCHVIKDVLLPEDVF